MKSYFPLFLLILSVFLSACASLNPIQVSSGTLPLQFNMPAYELEARVKTVLKNKDWNLIYDDVSKPNKKLTGDSNESPFSTTNWDEVAWGQTYPNALYPNKYLVAKTPISIKSYGAAVFIVISKEWDQKSSMVITLSSGQYFERDTLNTKLKSFIEELKKQG